MLPTQRGSFRLFRFAGVQVYLHWSWLVVALIEINLRSRQYGSYIWNVLEYVSLFGIVLLHEFGHALACRQVGGKAEQIILWPLGGVAYVAPPPRPGATLWSIAAGPLVNVMLVPILTTLFLLARQSNMPGALPDAYQFIRAICFMNLAILIFNLLPIYPLDGGQIFRALLWFVFGRAASLAVTAVVGFIGVAGLILIAIFAQSIWIGILAVFILLNCWRGLMEARLLARIAKLPRREGFACPVCHGHPVLGPFWRCARCLKTFDTFETSAVCPHCGTLFPTTRCFDCGNSRPMSEWSAAPPVLG